MVFYLPAGVCKQDQDELDAPAVAFGVFECALHFNVEDIHKPCRSNGFRPGHGQIWRSVSSLQDPHDRLLDPVRFEGQSECIAKHHGRT